MEQKKPNVIFIYPDQMRYDAMGNSGNSVIKTPGFDRMASQGVSFRNAYTSYPLCSPFRASVMTGKYAHSNGMCANHYPINLEMNDEFLPEILGKNGYKTGWVGKWHLGGGNKYSYVEPEYRCGFESFVGFTRGHLYNDSIYYRQNDKTPYKNNMYEPEYQTGHLFEFIDDAVVEERPFFAGICYGLPHPPLVADDWYLNLYRPDEMKLSESVPDKGSQKAAEFLAKYYGLVSVVDNQLTRILNYLDENGLADNTMVIVVSDHGEMAGEHNRYNKKIFYEAAAHVPFLIRYGDKFGQGRDINGFADPSVDIFPTILDACGIDIPEYAHGKSLIPYLDGTNDEVRSEVYYELLKMNVPGFEENILTPHRGIRNNKYLYISRNDKPYMLYDLLNDPNEMNNVINEESFSEVVKELDAKMHSMMKEYDDDWKSYNPSELPPNYVTHKEADKYARDLYKKAKLDIPSYHKK